jgi:hypothetical protein
MYNTECTGHLTVLLQFGPLWLHYGLFRFGFSSVSLSYFDIFRYLALFPPMLPLTFNCLCDESV